MTRLTPALRENLSAIVAGMARHGRDDPTIAQRLALTPGQVRAIRAEYDIPAAERRWLPTTEEDRHAE